MSRTWHQLEDEWYSRLDAMDKKKVPVYAVVDPIDKIIPSLVLFILLLVGGGIFLLSNVSILPPSTEEGTLILIVKDESGNPLEGVRVFIQKMDDSFSYVTNEKGLVRAEGIPLRTKVEYSLSLEGYESKQDTLILRSAAQTFEVSLLPLSTNSTPAYFQLITASHALLEGIPFSLTWNCMGDVGENEKGADYSQVIIDGVFFIPDMEKCPSLHVNVSGKGYHPLLNQAVDSSNPFLILTPVTFSAGKIRVTVFEAPANVFLSGIEVQLYTKEGGWVDTRYTDGKGEADFLGVGFGTYYVSLLDSIGGHASIGGNSFVLNSISTHNETYYMFSTQLSPLSVEVKEGSGDTPIPNATVQIRRVEDGQIVGSLLTSFEGKTLPFYPEKSGTFLVSAGKEGYVPSTQLMDIGFAPITATIILQPIQSGVGGSLHVKVQFANGEMANGTQLILMNPSAQSPIPGFLPLITNAQGEAAFDGLPPGMYGVRASLYPYVSMDSPPLAVQEGTIHNTTITLSSSLTEGVFTLPSPSPFQAPSFVPCETDCLPPLLVEISPSESLGPYESGTFSIHVGGVDIFSLNGVHVYVSQLDASGTKNVLTHFLTDFDGKGSFSLPASEPGTIYVLTLTHPGYEPLEKMILVGNTLITFTPALVDFSLKNIPASSATQAVNTLNNGTTPILLTNGWVSGVQNSFLDPFVMRKTILENNMSPISPGYSLPLLFSANSLKNMAADPGDSAQGQFILTFESTLTHQKWVEALPFSVLLVNTGSCDAQPLSVSGFQNGNGIEVDSFTQITEKKGVIQNTCTQNSIPLLLQNLGVKLKWNGKSLGKIQFSLIDVANGVENKITVSENAYTPLLSKFGPGNAYPYTLSFIPNGTYLGENGDFELFFKTQAGEKGPEQETEKGYLFHVLAGGIEKCLKIAPIPDAGVLIPDDKKEGTFLIDALACGKPVDVRFCAEAGNSGCSGGAPQGKISVTPHFINGLTSPQEITIRRIGDTLPGTYDVTVQARTTGGYRLLSRVNVKIESKPKYALDLIQSSFSLVGKGAKDSSIVENRLLKETVEVTSGLCNWMEVAKQKDAPFAPVFLASAAANILADALLPAAFDFSIVGAFTSGASPAVVQVIEEVINQVVSLIVDTLLGFGGGAAGDLAVAALNPCIPCTIIGIIVTIILQLLLASSSSADICQIMVTVSTMEDYVVNLEGVPQTDPPIPPDALNIKVYGANTSTIHGEWSTQENDYLTNGDNGKELVGVTFTNTDGFSKKDPLFGVAELIFLEHEHGDPAHKGDASVTCGNGKFQSYLIGPDSEQGSCSPAEDVVRKERFHVRFKTSEYPQLLPQYLDDRKACQSGTVNGFTGAGALPKVAFNWKWNEENGIPIRACDAANPKGIYCDATQFSIDLMKRIHALEGFLSANNYQFACPTNPNTTPDNYHFTNANPPKIIETKINEFAFDFQNPSALTLSVKIKNESSSYKDINFMATMVSTQTLNDPTIVLNPPTCMSIASLIPGQTFDVSCTIGGLAPELYIINWQVTDVNTGKNIGKLAYGIDVGHYKGGNPECNALAKSTAMEGGKPIINQWADAADEQFGKFVNQNNVKFTNEVPSIDSLNKLLHFDATLIQDGYSEDFENDFKEYYTKNSFADAPVWYKGAPGQPGYNLFNGTNDTFNVRRKYDGSSTLTASGRYHVDIDVTIKGDDWKFFDGKGNPKIKIDTVLLHRADPAPNSPYYRLPFDGQVGLVKDTFDRKGYGLNFINQNGFIYLNESPVITYTNTAGNTYSSLSVQKVDDLKTINTDPATRGQLLYVSAPNGNGENTLVFSPSMATPLIMKVKHSTTTPFTAFYQLAESGVPVDTGQHLTFWSGTDACMDFSGNSSSGAFNFSPDRQGKKDDKRTDWPLIYGIDWPIIAKTGDEYLRTVIYTPANRNYTMLAITPDVSFLTSHYGSYSSVQFIDGTPGLLYNNKSSEINSIQDVFDLVAHEAVCIEDNGVDARFVWNTAKLYEENGQTSINKELDSLTPGQTCIAP